MLRREFTCEGLATLVKRKGYRRLILIIFHKSRDSTLFLQTHRAEIKPFNLPTYSPKLNEVDARINNQLKKDVSTNHTYKSLESLEKAVRQYLNMHNRRHKLGDFM
jgi:hypothetical protein